MSKEIEDLVRRSDDAEASRSVFRQNMAEIAEHARPLRNELRGVTVDGAKRLSNIFDSTAINANQNLGAGLYGTLTNPADTWFQFATLDPDLMKSQRVRAWLDLESRRALMSCTSSYSAFYKQVTSFFLDLGAFGNAVFSSEMNSGMTGFVDMCRPLSECCWDVNGEGEIDTMYRRWKMTAAAAMAMFKDGISRQTMVRAEKDPKHVVEIMHACLPAQYGLTRQILQTNKPFVSIYAEVGEKHQISASGYYEFPYMVSRWETAAGEKTGRGPGELAIADIKSANIAQRDNLRAGNIAGNPMWGAPDEGVLQNIRLNPGKITYGAINSQGKQLLQPLIQGGNPPFSLEMTNALRAAIKDAFYFTLMQLVGRSGMTATEVMEHREERMRLMAPYAGGIQTDFLSPFALRRFNMLRRLGLTSPPPPELANRSIQVSFVSAFAQAQKSARATSVMRTTGFAAQLAQLDPEVADRLDSDAALRTVQEGFGAPADMLRSDEDTAARREVRRQAQRAAATAEIADTGAGAAQKGASALAIMQGGKKAA